eukprot:CAMPEP_0173119150 /NCGR_PEP_ID=MMETSP1102-20130122/51571_1 /TAXON_ID=49646 /ORGANISM="Geminigera sp., Strain Caron Lab Isolate" /LENGTH=447 /DNA_ID=CAMNT_0014024615 /DNA_START=46 /DNA_END=1389 /DNA_ORIENTATION=+
MSGTSASASTSDAATHKAGLAQHRARAEIAEQSAAVARQSVQTLEQDMCAAQKAQAQMKTELDGVRTQLAAALARLGLLQQALAVAHLEIVDKDRWIRKKKSQGADASKDGSTTEIVGGHGSAVDGSKIESKVGKVSQDGQQSTIENRQPPESPKRAGETKKTAAGGGDMKMRNEKEVVFVQMAPKRAEETKEVAGEKDMKKKNEKEAALVTEAPKWAGEKTEIKEEVTGGQDVKRTHEKDVVLANEATKKVDEAKEVHVEEDEVSKKNGEEVVLATGAPKRAHEKTLKDRNTQMKHTTVPATVPATVQAEGDTQMRHVTVAPTVPATVQAEGDTQTKHMTPAGVSVGACAVFSSSATAAATVPARNSASTQGAVGCGKVCNSIPLDFNTTYNNACNTCNSVRKSSSAGATGCKKCFSSAFFLCNSAMRRIVLLLLQCPLSLQQHRH